MTMTKEDIELLIKDLSERLPYKVHCCVYTMGGKIREEDDILYEVRCLGENVQTLKLLNEHPDECFMVYQVKPYLRPMTDMTEEESQEFENILEGYNENDPYYDFEFGNDTDWLNAHYFDYRGLIPKGLALVAKEGMYKI